MKDWKIICVLFLIVGAMIASLNCVGSMALSTENFTEGSAAASSPDIDNQQPLPEPPATSKIHPSQDTVDVLPVGINQLTGLGGGCSGPNCPLSQGEEKSVKERKRSRSFEVKSDSLTVTGDRGLRAPVRHMATGACCAAAKAGKVSVKAAGRARVFRRCR